jgi:hypothetical protein
MHVTIRLLGFPDVHDVHAVYKLRINAPKFLSTL